MPPSRRTIFGSDRQSGRVAGAGGFHGPPASPLKVGPGWPDSENVMLTEPGDALRTLWGYRRTTTDRLWDGIARERLELWAVPALEALGLDTGIGLAVVDGMNGRILRLEYNDAATPIAAKKMVFLMNRQGPHDYPSSVTTRGKTHIFTGWTEPVVHDGKSARLAGVRAPKRKPTVGLSGGDGFASLRNARYYWTASMDTVPPGQFFVRSSDTTNPGMNQNPSIANKPSSVLIDGAAATEGTLGVLAAGEWAYGDLDTLGYKTIYVRLAADADPDSQAVDFIKHSPMRIDSFNGITDVDGNANLWFSEQTVGAPVPVTVTNADMTVPLSPAPSTVAHLKMVIQNTVALGHLASAGTAQAGLAGEVIPPANANSFYLWVYVGGSGFTIAANTLKLRWTDQAVFAGKEQTFLIAQALNPGWNQVFFDYIAPSDVPLFDIKSIALVLEKAFAPEVPFPLELRFDAMTFAESGEASGGPGQYRARFSWFDSKRFRESDPSPISDAFFIADGAMLDIDVSGNLPGIDSGSQNINPAMHSIVDPDHGWVLSAGGTDEWYLTDANGENPVIAVAPVNVFQGGVAMTAGALGSLAVGEWAYGDADTLGHDTIYVRLTAGGSPEVQADAFLVYQDDTVDRVKIYIHRDDFGEDEFGRLVFGLVSPDMGNVIPFQTGPDFSAVISISAAFDQNRLVNPVLAPNYFRAVPEPVESVVLDSDVIVGGGQGDFAVGKVTIDAVNTSIASPVQAFMNTPRFRYWMEGRDFLVAEDAKKYFIAQVYSSIGYGKPDRIRIGSIDPYNTDAVIDGYQGGTGDKEYRIPGRSDVMFWTAKTEREGVYTEAMPLVNRLDCRMTGDSIRAVGRIREVLMIAGRQLMYNIAQDKLAIDDIFGSPPRYAMPLERRGFPGIMARRSQVTFADGNVGFLGQDTDLVIGSGLAFQKNPLSQRVRGFLNDIARIDTEKMIHAHSVYKRRRNCKIAHLIEFDADAGGCETKEQALEAMEAVNFPTVGPQTVLFLGTGASSVNNTLETITEDLGGTYSITNDDFETVVDLSGVNTLVIGGSAAGSLGTGDDQTWNPNAFCTQKIVDFLTAGGSLIVFHSGNSEARSTNAQDRGFPTPGTPGAGHAWEWLSSVAHASLPGPFEKSFNSQFPPPNVDTHPVYGPDDPNKGFVLTGHYITKNLTANPAFIGGTAGQGLVGAQIYDFNAVGVDSAAQTQYFRSIGSGLGVVFYGYAVTGEDSAVRTRVPVMLAGNVLGGKVIYMADEWVNVSRWNTPFFLRLMENMLNFCGLTG